jgi:pyruvate kinase
MTFPYTITATLGPASTAETIWEELIASGATEFRLNTSHLTLTQLDTWLERLQAFFLRTSLTVPVVLDLQGSKWRLGTFNPTELLEGQHIELILGETAENPAVLPVPHQDFFSAAQVSDGQIVLNDAKIRLRLEALYGERMQARVIHGGLISPHKGITYGASTFRQETLSEKDRSILEQTSRLGFLRYAISYIRDAQEIQNFRAQVNQIQANGGSKTYLIAKLERQPAVEQAAAIAAWADELWLCRGDLGAELGIPGMAAAAYQFTREVRGFPVPSILAGQVLEHMVASPTPTRSEVYTLYDALMSGYRGFVLSDEVAIGRHPIESCRTAAMFQENQPTR